MKKSFYMTILTALILCFAVLCCAHAAVSQVLVLPEGTKVIEAEAFYGDTSIREVVLPEGVETIGERAFAGSGVTKVNLPETLTYIAPDAFANVKHVYAYGEYGSYAEVWAKGKSNVTFMCRLTNTINWSFKDGVLNIVGSGVMPDYEYPVSGDAPWTEYRESVQRIVIGEGITKIGNYNFKYCENNTEIVFPSTLTYIGGGAFAFNYSIEQVTMPDSVTSTSWDIFIECKSLKYVKLSSNLRNLNTYVFSGTAIETITIPDSVVSIGHHAFYNCKNLTTVYVSKNVTTIGNAAFGNCPNLTIYGDTGTKAEEYAAANGVQYVDPTTFIKDFTYTIANGECTITGYTGTDTNVVIPSKIEGCRVTGIGDKAFYKHGSLTSIFIPNSVTSIGELAFFSCRNLSSICIPDSVTFIGELAFSSSGLTNISLPNSITTIEAYIFDNCHELTGISIPNTVTSIGERAFHACKSLSSISIPNSVTSIGRSAFGLCENLISISIPNSVISIGDYAFDDCESLTSITIPDSVTTIGSGAFGYCISLTSITIPDSVTSIGFLTFDGCSNLTIYGVKGSSAETYAYDNKIPFKVYVPSTTESALPTDYYKIINTYSCSGKIFYEANLIKKYNGVVPPDPDYADTFFFLDSKGCVVTDPTILSKLYTIYMYVHNESTINNSISNLNDAAKIWSASALDFMSKKAIWSHAGGLAGELVKTYATGGLNFVGVLTTIGKNIWSNVKEANELGSWLEIVFVQKLLGHLDQLATIAGSMPVKNGYGAYDFDSVQAKLAVYAHFKNTYKAVNSICIPVNDEIIEKFKSDSEVAMYYVANALMEAVDSVAEDVPFASVSLTMFRQIINGDQDELDVASNVLELIDEFAGIDLSDCGDLYDQLGNIGDVFDTVLGISQATALKDEAWLEPFYMTVDELKTTQLYKNHLLLAQ